MRTLLLVLAFIFLVLSGRSQSGNKVNDAEQEIRKLSNDWMRAAIDKDRKTLDRLVAPEFVLGGTDFDNPNLKTLSRDTWMKNTMEKLKVDSFRYDKMQVRIIDNVAIVLCTFYWSYSFLGGPAQSATGNGVDTWMKRKKGWQVVNRLVVDK